MHFVEQALNQGLKGISQCLKAGLGGERPDAIVACCASFGLQLKIARPKTHGLLLDC